MSTPPLNPPSFRTGFESQISSMPPEHQVVIRGIMNALVDVYSAFPLIKSQITALQKSSTSSTSSTSTSSTSTTSSGVSASQATTIAMQTINSTFNKVNNQTGTTYTVQNSDYAGIITLDNAGAVAVTLGGDGTGVSEQFGTAIENIGAGTATLTPASGTINGAATLTLGQNQGALLYFDGTNWAAIATAAPGSSGVTQIVAGTNITISPPGGTGVVTVNATTGAGGVSSLNALTGGLSLTSTGSTVTITPSGSTIDLEVASGGGLPVNNPTFTGVLTGPQYSSNGGTPTIAVGAAAGSGASVALIGTDACGLVNVTTGTGPSTGALCTITLTTGSLAFYVIMLTPSLSSTTALMASVWPVELSSTQWTINVNNAPSASTLYGFFYMIMGY